MQREVMAQGVLRAFDGVNWVATVQLTGSLSAWVRGVPVSRGIPAVEMVVGRRVAVAVFDAGNPGDAAVVAVWA